MILVYDTDPRRGESESDLAYVQRICSTRSTRNQSWKEVAQFLNTELGYSFSESYYRKHFNNGDFVSHSASVTTVGESSNTDCECIIDSCVMDKKILEMKKTRVKLGDERAQNMRYVARLAREETIKEIAHEYAQIMSKEKKLDVSSEHIKVDMLNPDKSQGILLLSDWHYGMVCDNPWNQFNPSICRVRISKLLQEVIQIVRSHGLEKVTVLNLSDLIAGRIHTQIRIESRIDVITQVMEVAEILAEFLSTLSQVCFVEYYDCLDNHSRIEPNKHESMDLESLVRIIPWYLKERLHLQSNIHIGDNEFGADIITCNVLGHNIIAVHGDNDNPTNALEKLSLMTHKHYDMLCTAHRHHFSMDEQHQSVVVSNSSLMGVDRYAEKLRLTSDPSQTFIIASRKNVCSCIYKINLN